MRVVINKLTEDARIPTYAHPTDSGADAYSNEHVEIPPGSWAMVGTGISVELPEGYELQFRSKSGMASKHGIIILNSPGTIDMDYRGEIKGILYNVSDTRYVVNKGDKIGQLVLAPVYTAQYVELQRKEKGFGSTGIQANDVPVTSIPTPVVETTAPVKPQEVTSVWIGNSDDAGFVNGMLSL